MSLLLRIADRALNRPLLITPDKAQTILAVLAGRIGVDADPLVVRQAHHEGAMGPPYASRFEGSQIEELEGGGYRRKPYSVTNHGVGIITITGSLVNRGAWVGASSGLTSYEGIGHQLKTAAADDKVKSVIIDLATPGGEATGAFETAELVRALSAKKRTVAIVNGMAASAGYAIASGAGEIVTTETGVSGSIGVVMLHADYSRFLESEGIKPTLIFAGAHKVDGNPFEPLSKEVRDDLQAEVMSFYDLFLRTVAKGRGSRLTAASARKTEARAFIGAAAVEAGLADRLGTFESVLADLTRAATTGGGRSTAQPGRKPMSETNGAPGAETTGIPVAEHDAAVRAAESRGHAAGVAEATAASNERFGSILGADGVRGDPARMAAALDLAVKSPAMAGADVVAFVTANVTKADPAADYETRRLAGAGLAQPRGTAEPAGKTGWDKAAETINRRRG